MKNEKIFVVILILIIILTSGCNEGSSNGDNKREYTLGETGTVDNIKITINDVYIKKDDPNKLDSYDKHVVIELTVTNVGNVPREIKSEPPGSEIYFYIQDIRGKKYIASSAFMYPKWQVFIEPGKTYNVQFYFYPGTPTKNAWMVVNSYNVNSKIVDSANFKLE